MEWILYIIIAAAALGAIYWVFLRKPASEEALPEAPQPERLATAQEPEKAAVEKPEKATVEKEKPAAKKVVVAEAVRERKARAEEPAKAEPAVSPAKVEEKRLDVGGAQGVQIAAAESKLEQQEGAAAPALVGTRATPLAVAGRGADVEGLRKGLGKSREQEGFFGRLAKLIAGRKEIDPGIVDELEEILITSDVGVATTSSIIERIRDGLKKKELDDQEKVWAALRAEATRILSIGEGGLTLRTTPTVILMVGVNGAGKTTTIGKLATQLKAEGRTVILAAGDTFRAAAVQQLEVWARRVGCEIVKGKDGADPGAVIFEAIQKAVSAGADVVIADTAGRLHTKAPLMDELKKIVRTMSKAMQGAPHETLLVLDATNGQNAVAQSRQFAEALDLTGIVLTKLDGTAKGFW